MLLKVGIQIRINNGFWKKFNKTMDNYERLKSSITVLELLLNTTIDTSVRIMIEQSVRIQKDVLENLKSK